MSLINDALKRVRQAQKKEASADAPLQPVQTEPTPRRASVLVIPICLVLVGVAGWFLWQWWTDKSRAPKSASAAAPATNRLVVAAKVLTSVKTLSSNRSELVSSAETALNPILVTNIAAASSTAKTGTVVEVASVATTNAPPERTLASTNAPASETETNILAAASSPKGISFPGLKLQAIYYRLSKPSVLINNKTLYLNDEIQGARIVEIERHSVKLESGGRSGDLWLK